MTVAARITTLAETAIGEAVMTVEQMGHEQRWTYYQRREGEARHANFVPVYRIRCVQGVLGEDPRYTNEGASLYPSEAHGLTPVVAAKAWPQATTVAPNPPEAAGGPSNAQETAFDRLTIPAKFELIRLQEENAAFRECLEWYTSHPTSPGASARACLQKWSKLEG